MLKKMFKRIRNSKGAALVEYSMLVAGIALIGAAAVAEFGHKTGDLIGVVAAILPGAHVDDNGPIISGKLIETKAGVGNGDVGGGANSGDAITLDIAAIAAAKGTDRLGNNLQGTVLNGKEGSASHMGTVLVLEPK